MNYNLTYGVTPGQNATYNYSLYVKVNGSQLQTIAINSPVNESSFGGAPPICSEDPLLPYCYYVKNFELYLDVSAFTANQPAQIQVYAAGSTSDQSAHGGFLFSGSLNFNFRFVLEQTSFSFQPRDSRDSVSDCGSALNNSNCYPVFQTTLMALDSTPPALGTPLYEVDPAVKIRFRLKFPKPHLKGTSSNNGDDLDPDYIINPSMTPETDGNQFREFSQTTVESATQPDGSFMVETLAEPTFLIGAAPYPWVPLKVTSRDFGGRARLYAEAIFGISGSQVIVPAEVGQVIEGIFIPAEVPSCISDDKLKFATLPIDQDCDDLADSWEAEYGGLESANWDAEPGPGGPHTGDGYTAHDEYRGFHFIEAIQPAQPPYPTRKRWERTDPKNAKDVFFWDESLYNIRNDLSKTLIGKDVNFVVREVDADHVNPIYPTPPTTQAWVRKLAKNSLLSNNDRAALALVFHKTVLAPGDFGDSQVFKMVGIPILYDNLQISTYEVGYSVSNGLVQAYIGAHESGHQFGLRHHIRAECWPQCQFVTFPPSWASSFGLGDYTLSPLDPKKTFSRLNHDTYLGQTLYLDRPTVYLNNLWHTPDITMQYSLQPGSSVSPNLPSVVETTFKVTIVPSASTFMIEMGIPSLMNWGFDPRHQNEADWKIKSDDLVKVCVHGAC